MTKELNLLNNILLEMDSLVSKGYDQTIVENAFMDFLGKGKSSVGSGITQTIKKSTFEFFISKLGVNPKSFMGQVLSNAFANVQFKDYYRLFTDCNFTTDIIAKTLLESFIDKWRTQAGFDSLLHMALKETLVEAATSTDMYKGLSSKLHGFICPLLKEASSNYDLNPLKKISGK
jgi:hypothetical protein